MRLHPTDQAIKRDTALVYRLLTLGVLRAAAVPGVFELVPKFLLAMALLLCAHSFVGENATNGMCRMFPFGAVWWTSYSLDL